MRLGNEHAEAHQVTAGKQRKPEAQVPPTGLALTHSLPKASAKVNTFNNDMVFVPF